MQKETKPAAAKKPRPKAGSKSEPAGGLSDVINASEILSTRAMLASVSISTWSASRTDNEISDKVNADNDAESDAGRWVKQLIPREALREITAASSAARSTHYAYTMPWLDDGQRILASAHYPEYAKEMQRCREAFEEAVGDFVFQYPRLLEKAEKRLGKAYKAEDYPTVEEIEARFEFHTDLMNVPATRDWRVELGDEAEAEIKQRMEERLRGVLEGTQRDTFERIAAVCENMAEALNAYVPPTKTKKAEHVFRASLVENVQSLLDLLPGLNVADDSRINAIIERMGELVENDTDILKGNPKVRQATASKAAAILKDVEAFLA